MSTEGCPLLVSASYRGNVGFARELLKHCPDAPYWHSNGWTCLHEAVDSGQTEFVEFILQSHQLRKLINVRDMNGKTALHCAVQKCHPKMVSHLLRHNDTDFTMVASNGRAAAWELVDSIRNAKTLNWVCVFSLYLPCSYPLLPYRSKDP